MSLRPYRILYYEVYRVCERYQPARSDPEWSTAFLLSAFFMMNALTIDLAFEQAGLRSLSGDATWYLIWVVAGGTLVINYFLFLHRSQYLQLGDELESSGGGREQLRRCLVALYVVLTFASFFGLAFIRVGERTASGGA